MTRTIILVFIPLFFIQCISQKKIDALQENKENYYPIAVDGKWGFANEMGKTVVPYKFDSTAFFTKRGIAVAKLNEKYGYLDKNGEWYIKPKYDSANGFFYETTLVVKNQDTFSINIKGRRLRDQTLYGTFGGCGVSTLPVKTENHSIEYDEKHALIFDYYLQENNGTFPLKITDTTDFVYDLVQNFGASHLLVTKQEKYGLFEARLLKLEPIDVSKQQPDNTGKYKVNRDSIINSLVNFQYDFVETNYDTTKLAHKVRMQKSGLWGVLNQNGTEGIPAEYLSIKHFYGVLVFVEYKKGKFGYKRAGSGKEYFSRN